MYIFSIIPFFLVLIAIPGARKLGMKYNIYDNPEGDHLKIHRQPIPNLGGVAMLLAVFIGVVAAAMLVEPNLWKPVGALSGGIIVFGLGLWDDLWWKNAEIYRPIVKFAAQVSVSILVAILLFLLGIQIRFIPIQAIMVTLAAFYVFGGINAINMQDGIDGLAGGLVGISAAGFTALSIYTGNKLGLVLSLATLGAVLGFLIYNFHPASIFMGDSGSHLLGFLLALLAINFTSKPYDFRWFIGPILIIGLPVFDAAWAVVRRSIQNRPLFEGDREHLYDRMMRRGLSVRQTVLMCYFIQALFVGSGIALISL